MVFWDLFLKFILERGCRSSENDLELIVLLSFALVKAETFWHYMDSPEIQSLTATWFDLFLLYLALEMFACD